MNGLHYIFLRGSALAVLTAVLAACGGGGGGDAGGGGSNPPPPPPPPPGAAQQLQLSTSSVTVGAASSSVAQPVSISGTVTGNPSAVFATVAYTNTGIDLVSTPGVDNGTATSTVLFKSNLLPGLYRDTITVTACPNAGCTAQFSGSPATIQVTYVVGLVVSVAAITVQTVEGATPPPAPVSETLTFFLGNGSWTSAVNYTAGSGWLTLPASGASLPATFDIALASQAAGTYTANLTFTATANNLTETRVVPVTYTVQTLLQAAAPAPFQVTNQQSSTQSRSVTVTSADPARNTSWTATSDSPWLTVTGGGTGTTGAQSTLQLALEPAEVAKLPNGNYTAQVTLDPALAGLSNTIVPVALSLDRTSVSRVAPYVGAANRSAQVIIRGGRFTDGAIQAVRFGSTDATAFQVETATRLKATYPSLPAGRYPVTVVVAGVTQDSSAELVLQDPVSLAAAGTATVPVQFGWATEFDAERHTCYIGSQTGLAALRANGSSWTQETSPVGFTTLVGLALTSDGRELLVQDANSIVHLDPVTLAETRRTALTTTNSSFFVPSLARVDDGTAAFALESDVHAYSPWNGQDVVLSGSHTTTQVRANTTGNRILSIAGNNSASVSIIDPVSGASAQLFTSPHIIAIAADRFGDRFAFAPLSNTNDLVITSVVGTEQGRIGGFNASDAVMSDDGKTLIVGDFSNGYRIIDLTPLASSGPPTIRATVPVPSDATDNLYLTPHQNEVVSCGFTKVSATAIPP